MRESDANDKVASAYNRWSQTYESVENPTRDLAATVLRQQSLKLRNRDVLEVGCGTGLNTRYLAEHCRSMTALDFSDGMLQQARLNVSTSNVCFLQNDIRLEWTVEDSSVDVIVCTLVLEHIEKLPHVFCEARRVLRAGGEFLLCELHPYRQLRGGRAQFVDAADDEVVLIPAFLHDVSDYVNASLAAGFELIQLGEWRDADDAAKTAIPRLLSVHSRARHSLTNNWSDKEE